MTSSQSQRSDFDALGVSVRGRKVVLGLVVVGALTAAAISAMAQRGRGLPEDPGRVMVVIDEAPAEWAEILRDGGFDVERATFEDWTARAWVELGDDAEDKPGLAGILELADEMGVGFVVLENPGRFEYGGLDLSGELPPYDEERFAVLSVGELASPHRVTVSPPPSPVALAPGIGALQALFAQERLDPEREELEHRPSVEELNLQDRITRGLFLTRAVPQLEQRAEAIREVVATTFAGPTVALGEGLRSGAAVPMPNGWVLTISQGLTIISEDLSELSFRTGESWEFFAHGPTALDGGAGPGERCETLLGGSIPLSEQPEFVPSAHGTSLLVQRVGAGAQTWVLDEDTPGCVFRTLGTVQRSSDEPGVGVPSELGAVARRFHDEETGDSGVRIHRPGAGASTELLRVRGWDVGVPAWVGTAAIVVPVEPADNAETRDPALWVLPVGDPGTRLEIPLSALEVEAPVHTLMGYGDRGVVVSAGAIPTRVVRVELSDTVDRLATVPVEPAPEAEAGAGTTPPGTAPGEAGEGEASNPWTVTSLFQAPMVQDPAITPDGKTVVFGSRDDGPWRVHVFTAGEGATSKALTKSEFHALSPRPTADGSGVVFQARPPLEGVNNGFVTPAGRRLE